jgi:hypothetical protein
MFISIAAVRARLRAVWRWLVNAASTCLRRARPGAHDAWGIFKGRCFAALSQAMAGLIDGLATAAKEAITGLIDTVVTAFKEAFALTPQGQFPAGL